jgi:hypothetical protein
MERIEDAGLPKKLVAQVRKDGIERLNKSTFAIFQHYQNKGAKRPQAECKALAEDILGICNTRPVDGHSPEPFVGAAVAAELDSDPLPSDGSETLGERFTNLQSDVLAVQTALFLMDAALDNDSWGQERLISAAQAQLLHLRDQLSEIAEEIERLSREVCNPKPPTN